MKHLKGLFAAASLLLMGAGATAQETATTRDPVLSPYFYVKSDDPETDRLPLKSTRAEVSVAGVIAAVTIRQVYRNEGRRVLEAVYTFPASGNAAVYAMEMTVGRRRIVARIEEKEQARRDYDAAKQAGKRASLLEQQRPNVFMMNVANILPGDEVAVTLRYTELLVPEDGVYRFVYPTVAGPRYASDTATGGSRVERTPYQREGEAPYYDFGMRVTLAAGMPVEDITCTTHRVRVDYHGMDRAVVTLDTGEKQGGNRDFVLSYRLAGDRIRTGLLLFDGEDEKFFLAVVQPPRHVTPADIPPREYIFINDVSGSMSGYPMDVSKKIMRNLVGNLRDEDRFNVLVFAGSSGWLADSSLPATEENIAKAVYFIDHQRAGGGTEILPALRKALSFPRPFEAVSRTFVIVTDGYVNVEREAFDLIRKHSDRANTFVFGIGSSVNRYLIDGMAHAGMGEPFVVLDQADAHAVAARFRRYITRPVLTQLSATYAGFDAYDVEPLSLPDVFAERPVILFGKYRGNPGGVIRLKGHAGRKRWRQDVDVSAAAPDDANAALRYLWARKRIQLLDDYGRAHGAVRDTVKAEVTSLGLQYNLLTRYTSFVAVEEVPVTAEAAVTAKQPLPLPQHVSNAAVGFEMALEDSVKEETVRYYSDVLVAASVTAGLRKAWKHRLETVLLPRLHPCFAAAFGLTSVVVRIGAGGGVESVVLEGVVDGRTRTCIEQAVRALDFTGFRSTAPWAFTITF